MMIEPPPLSFIRGRQALVHSIVVVRLASSTLFQLSSVTVSGVPAALIPTLLWRISRRQYVLTAKAAISSVTSALVTSPANTAASPPSSLICLKSFSARSALRFTSTTLAPSRANRIAVAIPLPTPSPRGAAPVTTATLPLSRPAMFVPLMRCVWASLAASRRHAAVHGEQHAGDKVGLVRGLE